MSAERTAKPQHRKFARFYNRFAVISIIAGLFPALVLSMLFVYTTRYGDERVLMDAYELALTRLESNVNSMLEYLCQNTLDQLVLNENIQSALTGESHDVNAYVSAASASEEIGKYQLSTQLYVDVLRVYTVNPDRPLYGQSISPLKDAQDEGWYQQYLLQTDGFFYHTKSLSNPQRSTRYPTLTLVEPIISTDFYSTFYRQTLGLARMDINIDTLLTQLMYREVGAFSGTTAAFGPDNQLLYLSDPSKEPMMTESALPLLANAGSEFVGLTLNELNAYLVSTCTSRYGIRLLMLFEREPLPQQYARVLLLGLLVLVLSLLIVALLSTLMGRRYSRRMELLCSKMALVRHGEFSASMPLVGGSDELTVLDEQFNYMVRRLRETINRSYVLELEKKDAQLRALQLQINPHFLYNTLESLNAITLMRGQTDVSDALEKLGGLFRYGVTRESRDRVTVREEIAHVESYFSIQQLRFPNHFEVFYNVPAEIESLSMPFFILQPIAENALQHGLGGDRDGTIEISAFSEGDDLLLSVEDDGVGMSEEQRDELIRRINDFTYNATRSIGMQNVHSRLRLMYGLRYGLTIESSLGRGTRVVARIPITVEEGDEHAVASADRR